MHSVDHLRREHHVIGRVATALATLAARRQSGADVPGVAVTAAVDFFVGFVGCHDAKEQNALFPVLAAHGADDAVRSMRDDRREAARLLGALESRAGARFDAPDAWTLVAAYVSRLRQALAREEGEVLPVVERLLSPAEDAAIGRKFRAIERRVLGRAGAEALLALADAIVAVGEASPGEAHGLLARAVMRPQPAFVGPDDTLARAAERMAASASRELPVVFDRRLVGILARRDMEPHVGHYEWTRVRAAMTRDPVTVAPDTPVADVARLLVERDFNAVPVSAGGQVVGMIGRVDVLTALVEARRSPGAG